jgi:hypothetical protein
MLPVRLLSFPLLRSTQLVVSQLHPYSQLYAHSRPLPLLPASPLTPPPLTSSPLTPSPLTPPPQIEGLREQLHALRKETATLREERSRIAVREAQLKSKLQILEGMAGPSRTVLRSSVEDAAGGSWVSSVKGDCTFSLMIMHHRCVHL